MSLLGTSYSVTVLCVILNTVGGINTICVNIYHIHYHYHSYSDDGGRCCLDSKQRLGSPGLALGPLHPTESTPRREAVIIILLVVTTDGQFRAECHISDLISFVRQRNGASWLSSPLF